MTIAIFHQKYEKVQKTNQNIPKTVDNHQEQLFFGSGFKFILASKKAKKPNFKIHNLSPPTPEMLPLFSPF